MNFQVTLVNKHGINIDSITGAVVSSLSELQDRLPFTPTTDAASENLQLFKAAQLRYV